MSNPSPDPPEFDPDVIRGAVPGTRRNRWNRTISPRDAEQAIYLDFEGTKRDPVCLVGTYDQLDGKWRLRQWAFDPSLQTAAKAGTGDVVSWDPDSFVDWLVDRSEEHRAKVIAWSEHDMLVLIHIRPQISMRFRNARSTARRWDRSQGADLEGDLQTHLEHIGYHREPDVVSGAGDWIRTIRARAKPEWEDVSRGGQEAWGRLVSHNATDLEGMATYVRARGKPPS